MNRDNSTPEKAQTPMPSIKGFVIVAVVTLGSFLILLAAAAPQGHDARSITLVACEMAEHSAGANWKLPCACPTASPLQ